MEYQLHQRLLEELKKKHYKPREVVHFLMEALSLKREAAYRRLRNEVPFTLQEAAIVAKKYAISLDDLIGTNLERSKTLRLKLPDFIHVDERAQHQFTDFIDFFESMSLMEETKTGVVTNALPQEIFSKYEAITKLNVFRWQYYYSYQKRVSYRDLTVSPLALDCLRKQYLYAKNIKETIYVFDRRILFRLVREIEYFRTIGMIDEKSVQEIRVELFELIDYLERLTETGLFPETGQSVQIYLTEIEVPFSCAYIKANDIEYTLMKTFILTSVTSFDRELYTKIKDWVFSSMRTSTLITQSSEIERVNFFARQREIVMAL